MNAQISFRVHKMCTRIINNRVVAYIRTLSSRDKSEVRYQELILHKFASDLKMDIGAIYYDIACAEKHPNKRKGLRALVEDMLMCDESTIILIIHSDVIAQSLPASIEVIAVLEEFGGTIRAVSEESPLLGGCVSLARAKMSISA